MANPLTVLPRSRLLQPGDRLGKHELVRQIAVGGMAELYLARSAGIEGFEKLVVVKRILPQFAANASFVNMFLNEARLAATLHHPNIAQVYEIGQEQGEYFFSMEYVHGEDLGHVLAGANEQGVPVSLDAALTLGAGLCAGLHHAHAKVAPDGTRLDIVHRDVSPSNVLVGYDGSVKLVDFGIARATSKPSTSSHTGLKGKIAYMSPEQCRGNHAVDRRSDIFSVGTILYELTTGQLPFSGPTEYAILEQIVNRDVPPPSTLVPGYPPALEAIVMRALARDRDQRFATALELQTQLEDFAHESRLRVSPLVLARLMSTLFPARLEEWDHARAQGAFFVEQHIVRTLIEKTGDVSPLADADVTPPVADEDQPTGVHTPPPGELVVTAEGHVVRGPEAVLRRPPRAASPIPGMPGAVPIVPLPPTEITALLPVAVPRPRTTGGDVTEHVRMPTRAGSRRRTWGLALALVGVLAAAGIAAFVVLSSEPASPSQEAATAPAAPAVAPAPAPAPPAVEPVATSAEAARPVASTEPAATVTPAVASPTAPTEATPATTSEQPVAADDKLVEPAPKPTAASTAKRPTKKPVVRKRPIRKKPARTTKEPAWNEDSPFLPVRPSK